MILTVLRIENLSADLEHERLKKSKADAVAVWCSGNALVLINAVALHRARLCPFHTDSNYSRELFARIIRANYSREYLLTLTRLDLAREMLLCE